MLNTLRVRLIVFFLIAILFALTTVGYVSYQSQKYSLREQFERDLVVSADSLARSLEDLIVERLADISLLATNPVIRNPDSTGEEIRREFQYFVDSNSIYNDVIFVDTNGIVTTDMLGGAVEGSDLSTRPWFNMVMEKNRAVFSDIYFSPVINKPILVLGTTVKDESNNVIGVISPAFDLDHVWKRIEGFRDQLESVGLQGHAFLINDTGDIISHPDHNKIFSDNFLKASDLNCDALNEFSKNKMPFYNTDVYTINAFAKIDHVPGFENNWYVIASVPKDKLYASLNILLVKYMFLFTLVLSITLFLILKFSKSIVTPIQELVTVTSDFAEGKTVTPIDTNSYEEINKLNEAFAMMTEKLEEREKELIQAEKLKAIGQMAAGLAHEIRNPLTTIKGFMQLITMKNKVKSTEKDYYEVIVREVDRVNTLVSDLLALARPSSANSTDVDINKLIEETIILYKSNAQLTNVTITTEFNPLPHICTDSKQLKQVFINIVKNAFEAMETGDALEVSTAYFEREEMIKVVFKDTGCGMDESTLEKLGTPFYTTKETGTGLGMVTVFRMLEEMNCKLDIKSKVGLGSTFIIEIPANVQKRKAKILTS